jgi:AAA ATPase domain
VGEPGVGLVERAGEVGRLRAALDAALAGRGGLVLVEGAAGVGKTSLLRAAEQLAAERGFAAFRARAGEFERDFAYGCARQLLEARVVAAGTDERGRLFAGAAGLAAPMFSAPEPAPPATAFATLHGLYWLLNNLAEEQPALLVVDDAQWADVESLRLLGYLAPRLDGLRLAVVVARRLGEAGPVELDRLALADEAAVLAVPPLTAAGVAEVCAERFGPVGPGFADACLRATGGNPFFLAALLGEVAHRGITVPDHVLRIGPAAVARAVLLRIGGPTRRPPRSTRMWRNYLRRWTRLNHVRTAAALAAGAALIAAGQQGS